MTKRVVLYTRVSTDEQARSGFSLPEQSRALRQHAESMGWEVVEEVSDPGNSGADPNRPGLLRVLEFAERGAVDLVLSWKRDRLFRDLYHRRNFEQDLAECGVRAVSLNDTGTRIGDKIMDVLSEEEREQIRDRTRAGKLGKARRGLMPGGNQVHFGFRFAGGKTERYEVDPAKMALVERIFRMVGAEGRSLTAVKNAFEKEGIPSPRGGRYWSTTTLRRIVENDVYLARPAGEVTELVSLEVAAGLDPELLCGVYWFGRVHMHRNYVRGRTKFTVEHNARKNRVVIPVPDCGVPPERVRFLPGEEPAEKRREAEMWRAARLQELYEMLDLRVTAHKARTLEVTWGLNYRKTPGRGRTRAETTRGISFRAVVGSNTATYVLEEVA